MTSYVATYVIAHIVSSVTARANLIYNCMRQDRCKDIKNFNNFRTLIYHEDMFNQSQLPGINTLFEFDKAYNPELLFHCIFIALKTK